MRYIAPCEPSIWPRLARISAFLASALSPGFIAGSAAAQTTSLNLGSASTSAGGSVSLVLSLSGSASASLAGLEWTLAPSAGIAALTVTAGPAATAAGKSVTCGGSLAASTCLLTGLNTNTLSDGIVAIVNITTAATASGTVQIALTNLLGASLTGNAVLTSGTGGNVTIAASTGSSGSSGTISSLICAPSSLIPGMSSACSVQLNQSAGPGGGLIALASSSPVLNVPTSTAVPAGASSASFSVNAGNFSTTQKVAVTASMGGSSANTFLSLNAIPLLTSLTCSPATLGPSAKATCTLLLSQNAPAALTIGIASSSALLGVPANVPVPSGAGSVSFAVVAAGTIITQNVIVTASLNGNVQLAGITLAAPLPPSGLPSNQPAVSPASDPVVSLSSLACTPSTLEPADTTTCVVTFSGSAPSGSAPVSLSSSSNALPLPATLAVSIGSSSASFTATADAISSNQNVTITASWNGLSQSTHIAVIVPAGPTLLSGSLANGATYIAGGLVPGSWAQVKGYNLATASRIWKAADFAGLGNNLPTSLSGTSVKVNGEPAPVYFVDPGQINFQVPAGLTGTASVQVFNNGHATNTVTAAVVANAPGIFPVVVNGVNYAAGVLLDGKYAGDPANGSSFRKATVGDHIQLYATGLVPSSAGAVVPFQPVSGVTVTLGRVTVPADAAGLVAPGEFQINFTVPQDFASLPEANYPVTVTVNGVTSPATIDTIPPGPIVLPVSPNSAAAPK